MWALLLLHVLGNGKASLKNGRVPNTHPACSPGTEARSRDVAQAPSFTRIGNGDSQQIERFLFSPVTTLDVSFGIWKQQH